MALFLLLIQQTGSRCRKVKEKAMYSKPLASRMDGMREGVATARRAQTAQTAYPVQTGAANFASFMPQGTSGMAASAMPSSGMPASAMSGGASMPGQAATPLEQTATQNNFGLNQMRAMASLAALQPGNTETGKASQTAKQAAAVQAAPQESPGIALNARDLFRLLSRKPDAESAETALRVKSHRKGKQAQASEAENVVAKAVSEALAEPGQKTDAASRTGSAFDSSGLDSSIGKLAAQFESGSEGIAAVGYDRHGGTSYGKYQIASRVGTMSNFISFLKTEAPDVAERLEKAGPANTGGKRGKMPETWKQIAEEEPDRFEALQDKFIRASHFEPAMRALAEKTGMAFDEMPSALHEVVFSTAVQHGPKAAERIVSRALDQVGSGKLDPEQNDVKDVAKAQENLIRRIYANRSGQFRSSTETVQAAVKSRLRQEMSMAINMLRSSYVEA